MALLREVSFLFYNPIDDDVDQQWPAPSAKSYHLYQVVPENNVALHLIATDSSRKARRHGQIPISRSPSPVKAPSNRASTSGQYSASTSANDNPTPITDIVRQLWEYREVRNAIEDYDKELFKKIANCIFR